MRNVSYSVRIIRNGAVLGEVLAAEPPSVRFDSNAAIMASFQGTFLAGSQLDVLKDELQPMISVDGEESSLGIFVPATWSQRSDGYGRRLTVEAYDRTYKVQCTRTETRLHYSTGDSYMTAIEQLLAAAGIALVLSTPSDAVFSADREDWEPGTDHLTIINQLLGEIGYRPLWFDGNGFARLEPYKSPSAAGVIRQYSASDIRRLPMGYIVQAETDMYDAPNVFICVCSNPDNDDVMIATSTNDSVMSGKSTVSRGRRICQVYTVDQVSDLSALQTYADRLRDESILSSVNVMFQVPAASGHGYGDIIAIDHPDIGGIYEEQSWDLRLEAGKMMRVSASKICMM